MIDPPSKKTVPLNYSPPPARPVVPAYRKAFAGILIVAGLAVAIAGLFAPAGPARTNDWTVAAALLVYGLVIRFQHVRL